jgi:MFS family permease
LTSLLIVRFLAGLPHGAYFGVASVVAAKLVPAQRRSSAMAVVFAGLTVANVIGVPATTLIGQHYGWRLVFSLVGAVEVLAAVAILAVVPIDRADLDGSAPRLRQELRAFRQPQIWLSLSIAMARRTSPPPRSTRRSTSQTRSAPGSAAPRSPPAGATNRPTWSRRGWRWWACSWRSARADWSSCNAPGPASPRSPRAPDRKRAAS